jgi:hypothetical protein
MASPPKRKQYSDAALAGAVERVVLGGERCTAVGRELHIPYRTLLKYVARRRRGDPSVAKRRGPPPALTQAGERQLLGWMRELQAAGLPVRRRELLVKANEVLKTLNGPEAEMSTGWYGRFRDRHPEISGPGAAMIIEDPEGEEEVYEESALIQEAGGGECKTREQLEKEQLLQTPVEKAVVTVQESYAQTWRAQDVVDAFDLMLDPTKAEMLLVMKPGDLRDMWLRKQLRTQRAAASRR